MHSKGHNGQVAARCHEDRFRVCRRSREVSSGCKVKVHDCRCFDCASSHAFARPSTGVLNPPRQVPVSQAQAKDARSMCLQDGSSQARACVQDSGAHLPDARLQLQVQVACRLGRCV